MRSLLLLVATAATAVVASSMQKDCRDEDISVPSLDVPACPDLGSVTWANTVPSTDNTTFPKTEVALCYDDSFIQITFTALEETSFYCASTQLGYPTPGLRVDGHKFQALIWVSRQCQCSY